ncbi:MAG: TonB-dependent receptor [Ignavibacteriales bacterium]|nr:TonB-dependent receptor [Ignavibacteriales bacterium]
MIKQNISYTALCAVLLILLSINMLAQSPRGKISGVARDEKTREALIGVNIIVDNTDLGAVSDGKGKFFILNVPVGVHNITARYIGYAPYKLVEVEVNADRTTEVSFLMKDAAVQLEQVVVVAKRPNVIKDQTSSSATLSAEQLKAAPVEGLRGALELAADLQRTATGNLSIRGSGSYDVNFQINGIDQVSSTTTSPGSFGTEKANNSWKYDVNPIGISQVQLITGGFSAEYGNAQAGVVKVVMKEGTPKMHGEARVEYRPAGQYHYGDYMYSQNTYEWKRWGKLENWMAQKPAMISELKLDTRYEALYKKIAGRTASASDSANWNTLVNNEINWAYNVWLKNHTPSDDNPLGVYDYRQYGYKRYMFGFGGPLGKDPNFLKFFFSGEYRSNPTRLPTPEKNQIYQNYILNITATPFIGHKIKLMGSFQKYRGGLWSGSEDIRWSGIAFSPPGLSTKYYITTDPVRTEQTVAQSCNWVYTINQSTFFELTVAHQFEQYSLPYEYLTGWSAEADRLDSLGDTRGNVLKDGIWWDNTYYRPLFNFSTNYYQDTRTENWALTADYTHQFQNGNLLKTGIRGYYWDLFNNGVNSSFLPNTYISRSGYAEYYHAYPFSLGVFVQDKMEFEGMVANFGLRAEMFNFNKGIPVDMFNVFYQGKDGANPTNPGNPETVDSKTKYILMPRAGLSFPIGEKTAFRIQYGHFASMPTFSHALSNRTQNGWTGLGNADLDYRKTINYEFGLQQVLDENQRLDVALYYNDRTSQVGLLRVASYVGSRERAAG